MTKKELKEQLQNGKLMSDLFDYTYGQDCDIYKNDEWELSDDIIYIPDIQLNNIEYFDYLRSKGEIIEDRIEEIINCTYTGKDFMELANGDEEIAKELFYYVDWQHPSSALNEVIEDVEETREEYRQTIFPELNEYYDNDGDLYRDLNREDDGTDIEEIGRYEIIFDVAKQRYYCFVDAINMDEALGIFFKNHQHVTYEMIVDHMEV